MTDIKGIISEARRAVSKLSAHYVDAKPENYDFGDRFGNSGDEERWDWFEAVECDDCGQYIVDGDDHAFINGDGQPVPGKALMEENDLDEDDLVDWAEANGFSTCPCHGEDFREFDSAEGPMMNYRYPIDDKWFNADGARRIADLPLCIVMDNADEEVYLALTGGGMDLSWEICEAYVRLGCLPPSHFELPAMAGKKLTERTALVLTAVERSNDVLTGWAQSRKERTSRLLATIIEETQS
jgi:hypothetical protein